MDESYKIGRIPDYDLSVLSKSNEHKGKVGVGWINQDGSISIKLNPFVVLSASQDLLITLFRYDREYKKALSKKNQVPDSEITH